MLLTQETLLDADTKPELWLESTRKDGGWDHAKRGYLLMLSLGTSESAASPTATRKAGMLVLDLNFLHLDLLQFFVCEDLMVKVGGVFLAASQSRAHVCSVFGNTLLKR